MKRFVICCVVLLVGFRGIVILQDNELPESERVSIPIDAEHRLFGNAGDLSEPLNHYGSIEISGLVVFEPVHISAVKRKRIGSKEILALSKQDYEEVETLALNLYHEVRGKSYRDICSVAEVTMNRVKSKKYPNSIKGVVYQSKQYSWTHDELSDIPTNRKVYVKLFDLAYQYYSGELVTNYSGGADHYHNYSVNPHWADEKLLTAVMPAHKFYKLH